MTTDYTRTLSMGATAADSSQDAMLTRLQSTRVHLTAQTDIPGVPAALKVLIGNLRRLPIQLSIAPGQAADRLPGRLLDEVLHLAAGIDETRPLRIGSPTGGLHIHLGTQPPTTAAASAVPDGHGVRLRAAGSSFPNLRGAGTGLGAVAAAATLTGEVFKVITGLHADRFRPLSSFDFCPVTLTRNPGDHTQPVTSLLELALIGTGAIGTAIAVILDALAVEGNLTIVDPEHYDDPNLTTYSLGTRADARDKIRKVDLLERELNRNGRWNILPIHGTAQDLINKIDARSAAWPRIVLGAVDSIAARHELQRIQADLTLDGSTGGHAGTTLALHEALPLGPCLRCYYPAQPLDVVSAEEQLHKATGLSLSRIAQGDSLLNSLDLAGLSAHGRQLLARHLGQPICGLSKIIVSIDEGTYRPSAAFVAQQAAVLVIGALIARTTGCTAGPRHTEYDALFGPYDDMTTFRLPQKDCDCQTHSEIIMQVRSLRSQAAPVRAGDHKWQRRKQR
ncbi:hypothetical protein E1293_07985 [Actinomadura darangshiensis]|uniref:THIF-type NAD/FAD binding fold domain-containing protein n=1 Tax=Actinomadura darangshiensis TaxID=705336 RepID=A0A4R5BN76_9ACTN|nr:ThiF family adenylyltransferase [Actinomadura darangshiensis]TDD87335.1 hypothetical protein E1293_07985 [Actinomadura darangshiensis]